MFAAGTRVRLLTAIGDRPAGSVGHVVYDLGGEVCEIVLESGEHLTLYCAALLPVDDAAA